MEMYALGSKTGGKLKSGGTDAASKLSFLAPVGTDEAGIAAALFLKAHLSPGDFAEFFALFLNADTDDFANRLQEAIDG
jgi:hypothetical protein